MARLWFQLLSSRCLLLRRPAPLDGLGNALPSLRAKIPLLFLDGEFAFLCGLLHDLGKVAFFKKDVVGYSKLFAMGKSQADPDICACEVEQYGVNHAVLGARLAKQWRLPIELSTAVRCHHYPGVAGLPLVAAVSMADMLIKQADIGYDGDRKIRADLSNLQLLLKMDQQEFATLSVLARNQRADVEEFFQFSK